jgi:S1-C subfamily serine protease
MLVTEALPGIAMIEDLSFADSPRPVGQNIIGTAFAADSRGYFLTAKHVVQGIQAFNLELRTTFKAHPDTGYAMRPFPVQAIYPHPRLDIAVKTSRPSGEQFRRRLIFPGSPVSLHSTRQ